jgi:hypothetical protein
MPDLDEMVSSQMPPCQVSEFLIYIKTNLLSASNTVLKNSAEGIVIMNEHFSFLKKLLLGPSSLTIKVTVLALAKRVGRPSDHPSLLFRLSGVNTLRLPYSRLTPYLSLFS